MTRRPDAIRNIDTSVRQRLFNLAKEQGRDFQSVLKLYFLEGAKPQRFYVPVRAADYGRLTRLCSESDQLAMSGHMGGCPASTPRAGVSVLPRKRAMPILDTETGKEYGSKGAAGRDLYLLVDGDITDRWVWFKIARAFPSRFHTKNSDGCMGSIG